MRRYLSVLVLLLMPSVVFAQHRRKPTVIVRTTHYNGCCNGNRFSFEPYAGAVKDPYDISPDGSNTSALFGFRVGYLLGWRARLLGNIGYTKSDNVSNPQGLPNYFVYDNTWVFTTGGAEFDVVPGRASAALGLQAGAAWRRTDLGGQIGTPGGSTQEDRGFHASEVLIPSVSLRHRVSSRLGVSVGVHDNIFDVLEGPAQHGVGATFGVSFR